MYDITDADSLDYLKDNYVNIKEQGEYTKYPKLKELKPKYFMIGNKIDLVEKDKNNRKIKIEDVYEFCKREEVELFRRNISTKR